MERYRLEVGHQHEVMPGNIVGAIANEAGLDSQYIGRITIHDDHSLVDLPEDMPKDIFNDLKKTRVASQALKISRIGKERTPSKTDSSTKNKEKGRTKDKSKARPAKSNKKKVRKKNKPANP